MFWQLFGVESTTCSYDVIIVLGAAVWQGGKPSPALRRRTLYGADLACQGQGRMLLLSGGLGRYAPPEAHVMRQVALAAGVCADRMILEDQATSTFWSAVYCARILRQHGWLTALIVSDRYHLPRAVLTFRCLGIAAMGRAVERQYPAMRLRRRFWAYGRETVACIWYIVKIAWWKMRHRGPNGRTDIHTKAYSRDDTS
jgi:uncharacterized SAM-binding protein YcdF (DUF218 family)